MGSKAGSASKVRLSSFDDLFGGVENTAGEQIINAKLSDLHTFKGHSFRVVTRHFIVDEKSILFSTV